MWHLVKYETLFPYGFFYNPCIEWCQKVCECLYIGIVLARRTKCSNQFHWEKSANGQLCPEKLQLLSPILLNTHTHIRHTDSFSPFLFLSHILTVFSYVSGMNEHRFLWLLLKLWHGNYNLHEFSINFSTVAPKTEWMENEIYIYLSNHFIYIRHVCCDKATLCSVCMYVFVFVCVSMLGNSVTFVQIVSVCRRLSNIPIRPKIYI